MSDQYVHPNCKKHKLDDGTRDESQPCSCEAWWEQERIDGDRIAEMACKLCGDANCDGTFEMCPELDIDIIRKQRDSARKRLRQLRDDVYEARASLLKMLGRDENEARRSKPTLATLLVDLSVLNMKEQ